MIKKNNLTWAIKCIAALITYTTAMTLQSAPAIGALSNGTPMLVREVIIAADQNGVPDPHSVVRSDADSLVIAGKSRLTAWAMKADFEGNVRWKYASSIVNQFPGSKSAEFNSAASMDDGTTFLCGNINGAKPYSPGLLTLIDTNGHVLSERPVYPQGRSDHGIVSIRGCTKWDDGVLMLGNIMQFEAGGSHGFYWLAMLDHAGKISWEKLVPTKFDWAIRPIVTEKSEMVFFEHSIYQTKMLNINAAGDVKRERALPGNWMPVYETFEGGKFQLYGEYNGVGNTMSLDKNFDDTGGDQYVLPKEFTADFAFRISDTTTALVGRGNHRQAQVCRLDFSSAKVNCLQLNHQPFIEAALVAAVVPLWDKNEVLAIRPVLRRMSNGPVAAGLALDFIKFQ